MVSLLGTLLANELQEKQIIFSLKLYFFFFLGKAYCQTLSNKYDSLVFLYFAEIGEGYISSFVWKQTDKNFSLIVSQQVIFTLMSLQSPCSTTSFITLLTFPVTSLGLLMQALAPWGSLMRNSHLLHYPGEQLHCTERNRWEQFGLDSSASKNPRLIKSRSEDCSLW